MDKKKGIIIGASVGAGILLCTGLGLGLGLGLSNRHVNDPILEQKYIQYRKEYVEQLCKDLYNKNKLNWDDSYAKILKENLKPFVLGLDTKKEWYQNGNLEWQPFLQNPHFETPGSNGVFTSNGHFSYGYVKETDDAYIFSSCKIEIVENLPPKHSIDSSGNQLTIYSYKSIINNHKNLPDIIIKKI